EKTIGECNDIFQFQLIAKAGSKYKEAYHLVDGERESVQKVNRVYASKDKRYGKLFKVKAENDSTAKIESLPEHCIIDNANKLTIEDVDKTWYIELAKKRINDFLGIKPIKNKEKNKMTTTNVYQKLLKARASFLNSQVTKSGKNMHLAFKYFELDDIVPKATAIFEEVGILPVVSFEADKAIMVLANVDKPDDTVTFALPLVQLTENKGTNAVQAFGATVTYYRRYLYMIALDICEPDEIDAGIKGTTPTVTPVTAPTPTEKPLTNADGNASEIQLKQLKEVLKKLKDADPSKEDMITKLAVETKGFTVISKADCEALTLTIVDMIKEVQ
ncbi:MAG: ERF family protein, partial [Bacteroidales bacterium]|nr:ERF family protein [Bacteroidales bacterium]